MGNQIEYENYIGDGIIGLFEFTYCGVNLELIITRYILIRYILPVVYLELMFSKYLQHVKQHGVVNELCMIGY